MTVKDAVIALCFVGSILLAILGGWNYMKGRIVLYQEKVKIDKMLAAHQPYYSAEEKLKEIGKKRDNALIMFAVGATGIFVIIAYMQRRRKVSIYPSHIKTKQP